jgi:hypothetical protein
MAKRTRGSHRPGRRPPLQREATRPSSAAASVRPSTSLTPEEEARAAEIEAQIVAEERAAEQATRRSRDRGQEPMHVITRLKNAAPLSVRAADEYAYVRRDIRRIARIGIALLVILAVLHVLINVLHVIDL